MSSTLHCWWGRSDALSLMLARKELEKSLFAVFAMHHNCLHCMHACMHGGTGHQLEWCTMSQWYWQMRLFMSSWMNQGVSSSNWSQCTLFYGLQLLRQEEIKMKQFSAESTCQPEEIKMDVHSAHQPQFNEDSHHELVTSSWQYWETIACTVCVCVR